ncbi:MULTISPECIES: alpha-xylosidase [Hungatella]|uniref:alpha-D-xyloside xylohydrolase n=1 Tax=Hungatella hathewayi TaxID=154046 RepID=A0AAW9WGD0_9FIRM|nr:MULTISPECIES: alpha-xylosidase [Hungatella]MCQ4831284.1 alpha-xylosidase [Hungatella sp. SL.1.14]MUB64430.1 alpha-xylosidase [Hungatella hathewayi]CUP90018.1 alpha-xylosidase [Hungatella hathewayi]
MKFTEGYWCTKKEITPLYATEFADSRREGDELILYAPGKHIAGRGDCLNLGMLTVRLSSPMEDVIKVSVRHFEGTAYNGPFARIHQTTPHVTVEETEDEIRYQSGRTTAVIDKRPNCWGIRFLDGERELTSTGYRNMAHMTNRDTGKTYMVEQLAIDVDECIYGLGERYTPFVKNGQVVEMWNEDGGTASEITYKNIPFYITNKGYGVLLDNEGDAAYEIASEKVERLQFSVEGERLDYYVINGSTPKGTISKYTKLTGKPALPPAWSFGLWLTTSFTTNYDEGTTSGFIQGMADRDIPLHVFHFDCYWMEAYEWCNFTWDPKTFPDPAGMLKRYHDRGLKICVWINPYIGQKSPLFQEGMEHGYLIRKTNGDVWQTDMWQAGMGLVDFTNPDAAAWYQGKLKTLLDMGVDCFKTDFGERVPVKDIAYYDGSDPVKMHNYYTYLYNQAVFQLLERERGTGEAVLFARSATVGGQQFPAHWGGDCSATYPSMAETIRSGLSLACAGFGFWSHDISGFENTAPADIYKRWCQFGLLSSHSRLHGSSSYRVPWLFDDEACDVLRKFVKLKCALMPYLYRQAVKAHEEGIPMMRPMFVEFPEDRACEPLDKQYMLGDSLLVAPVFKESGEVEYYLPEGVWVNLLTGTTVKGGRWQKETHDYFSLPLMVRPGSIVAVGQESSRPDYDFADGVRFLLWLPEEGMTAETGVTDLNGNVVMTVSAGRADGKITLRAERTSAGVSADVSTNITFEVLGEEKLEVVVK